MEHGREGILRVVVDSVFTLKTIPVSSLSTTSFRPNLSVLVQHFDAANFRGHRRTYLEKVYQNKMDPQYLLLSQPLRTSPSLDVANFRGHGG